jgi:glycosyltransferase involved in cell wall biosynthesis
VLTVRWQGDIGLPTSLSIINDRVSERLTARVQRVSADRSRAVGAPLPHAADIEIRHQWPPDLTPPHAGRLAVILPWEFGAVPREWLAAAEANVDELWVPSEYVRRMYIAGGTDENRVAAIPNGVDLNVFTPDGPRRELPGETRFLFVGGLIWRKGADLLLEAWRQAFAGREDVTLVIKDFGADGVYRSANREPFRAHAASGALPRIVLLDEELELSELAALYRSCDVLVAPYRGEGFAMPVLEAMACGLPVIATAGGPTDEFSPPEAGWRIRSRRATFPEERVDAMPTAGRPWVLEPDLRHLVELLRSAQSDPDERRRRGCAGRQAAQALSWDAVAEQYEMRIAALAQRRPRLAGPAQPEPFPLSEDVDVRVLATPAWRGEDRLGELLAQWCATTTPATRACLYLLADPTVDGTPEELEARVLDAGAAAGAAIDSGADINVLMEPSSPGRDARLHAAVDAYVPLHPACTGHARLAREAGNAIVEPSALRKLVSGAATTIRQAA